MISKISDLKSFEKEVVKSSGLTLVEFATEWSGSSQMVTPIFTDLATRFSKDAKFCLVTLDENTELETEFSYLEVPSILFFINGHVVDQIKGSASKQKITDKIETLLQTSFN